MTPKTFPEVNVIYAKDQPEYNPLPVYKDSQGTVVSCWELTAEAIQVECLEQASTYQVHPN